MSLCLKTMSKTMDTTKLSSEKRKQTLPVPRRRNTDHRAVEFATMTLQAGSKQPLAKIYRQPSSTSCLGSTSWAVPRTSRLASARARVVVEVARATSP